MLPHPLSAWIAVVSLSLSPGQHSMVAVSKCLTQLAKRRFDVLVRSLEKWLPVTLRDTLSVLRAPGEDEFPAFAKWWMHLAARCADSEAGAGADAFTTAHEAVLNALMDGMSSEVNCVKFEIAVCVCGRKKGAPECTVHAV